MNIRRKRVLALALVAIFSGVTRASSPQAEGNDPTALIVSYRAMPGLRAKFRSVMATEGVAQLDRWKSDGVFASYSALFTAYASNAAPDMFLVLRFNHFTDLERWQEIEKIYPGGLPESAQSLAVADFSATADVIKEERAAGAPASDTQFLVLEYDVTADMPKYTSYVQGYAVPQFHAWMKAGVLVSYAAFTNQNPAGALWSSLILLEYKDLRSLASREAIKNKARADLRNFDPGWKRWSEDKTTIRKEIAAIPALSLKQ